MKSCLRLIAAVCLLSLGAWAQVTANPTSLSFPTQTQGTTSAPQTVTFTNGPTASATVLGVSVTGNFNETNTCGTSLAVSASCTASVTFTPQSSGNLNGTLTISFSNAQNVSVPLQGTGAAVGGRSINSLTSNNTSASSSFTGWTDGDSAVANTSNINTHKLFQNGTILAAEVQPWFCGAPNVSFSTFCQGHVEVGYNSTDATEIQNQLNDMRNRGIDAATIDWYGKPTRVNGNGITVNNSLAYSDTVLSRFVAATGPSVGAMYDFGALKAICQNYLGNGYNTQQACVIDIMTQDMKYLDANYWGSGHYLQDANHNPIVMVFEYDQNFPDVTNWTTVWDSVKNAAYNHTPKFIFGNAGGFTHADTNGAYAWGPAKSGNSYLDYFYNQSLSYPSLETWGGAWPGFNDTLANWSLNRINPRNCGLTWLASAHTWADNGAYSDAHPLPFAQLITWNDYEEGSEIETGIDNCISWSTPTISGTTLSWNIGTAASTSTIDHFEVYYTSDNGATMFLVSNVSPTVTTLDLSKFTIPAGTYSIYVFAVGQPSIHNSLSPAVSYTSGGTTGSNPGIANPQVAVSLSPSSAIMGTIVTATVTVADTAANITSVTIDWGDGSAPQTIFGSGSPTPTPTPTSTYYTLTVGMSSFSTSGNTVTSSPAGVSCPGVCVYTFAAGTSVTLTANPGSPGNFSSWGGDCAGTGLTCTLTMNTAHSVTASFH